MTPETALRWANLEILTVGDLVKALALYDDVPMVIAIRQFADLTARGLPVYAAGSLHGPGKPDSPLDPGTVAAAIVQALAAGSVFAEETKISVPPGTLLDVVLPALAVAEEVFPQRLNEMASMFELNPRLGDLLVTRRDAFRIFRELNMTEPFPWKYWGWPGDDTEGGYLTPERLAAMATPEATPEPNTTPTPTATLRRERAITAAIRKARAALLGKHGQEPTPRQVYDFLADTIHNDDDSPVIDVEHGKLMWETNQIDPATGDRATAVIGVKGIGSTLAKLRKE